jgi:hypothetical protein
LARTWEIFVVGLCSDRKSNRLRLGSNDVSVEFQSYRPASLRITRQGCDFGRWEIASRGPHSQLRDYVIGYVGLRPASGIFRRVRPHWWSTSELRMR